jgi:hypothetical protein
MAPDNAPTTTVSPSPARPPRSLEDDVVQRAARFRAKEISVGAPAARDAFARPGNATAPAAAALSPQPSG